MDALDGMKNGVVDYTLLVASVLPPDVYCDDARICEIFEQFDIQKRGAISGEDLQTTMRAGMKSRESNTSLYAKMVSEFDLNRDGQLDLNEFREMLRAGADQDGDGGEFAATPMTEPTPSCTSTSRASPGTGLAQTPTPTPGSRVPATPTPTVGLSGEGGPPMASPPSRVLFASPQGGSGYPSR